MFLLKKHRKIASKKTAFTLRFAVFSFLLWFPLKSFLPAFSLRLMFTQLFPCIFFEKSPRKTYTFYICSSFFESSREIESNAFPFIFLVTFKFLNHFVKIFTNTITAITI